MKVVILCGGKGTRIRGVADDLPKPMIPIGPYPILWHIMRTYAAAGHKDFILCLGYKSDVIKSFFLNYRTRVADFTIDFAKGRELTFHGMDREIDWRVTLVETGEEALTGSRVKRIEPYVGDDDSFMLTYGDGVADIDLAALETFHGTHRPVMTVSGVRPPGRFGELDCRGDGRITEFNEKPNATGGRISGGYFICDRALFDYLPGNRDDVTLETEPMRRIAAEGRMMMYPHDGFWQCMDTYRDYALLNDLWAQNRAPWAPSS